MHEIKNRVFYFAELNSETMAEFFKFCPTLGTELALRLELALYKSWSSLTAGIDRGPFYLLVEGTVKTGIKLNYTIRPALILKWIEEADPNVTAIHANVEIDKLKALQEDPIEVDLNI